jgi:glycerophosphoryl diester phosphodiesterase
MARPDPRPSPAGTVPAVQQRLPSLIDPPVAFAHRGARAHAPENTLEAFALALRLGATGLESDVWLTSDGIPVLDHDGFVRGRLRSREIRTVPRAALPSHVPALTDLIETCGSSYDLSLDLMDDAAGPVVLHTIREAAPDLVGRLWLCHRDWSRVAELRPLDPDVRLVDSTRLIRIREGPERRAATLADAGVDAINMHHADWTGGLTTLFHRFDRLTLAWDAQHERVLRDVLRMGIDGVYSDWVDRLTDAFRAEVG